MIRKYSFKIKTNRHVRDTIKFSIALSSKIISLNCSKVSTWVVVNNLMYVFTQDIESTNISSKRYKK